MLSNITFIIHRKVCSRNLKLKPASRFCPFRSYISPYVSPMSKCRLLVVSFLCRLLVIFCFLHPRSFWFPTCHSFYPNPIYPSLNLFPRKETSGQLSAECWRSFLPKFKNKHCGNCIQAELFGVYMQRHSFRVDNKMSSFV